MAKKKKDNSVIFGKTKKLTEATMDMDNDTIKRLVSFAHKMPENELAGIVATHLLGKMTKKDLKDIETHILSQRRGGKHGKA